MRFGYVWLACVLTIVTSSCGNPRIILEIDLEHGTLTSPTGEHKLRLRSKRSFKIMHNTEMAGSSETRSALIVHGHDANYEIALFTSPSRQKRSLMHVAFAGKDRDKHDIKVTRATYYYGTEHAQPLDFGDGFWHIRDRYAARAFVMDLPQELSAHDVYETGDGIRNASDFQEKLESERYRFLIELLINNEAYVLDMTLRFRLGSGSRFGIPAMP